MLAMAGHRIGLQFRFYDSAADACAGQVDDLVTGSWDDQHKLRAFAETCDLITYEWENVPVTAAEHVAGIRPLRPGIKALRIAQDRLTEKLMFSDLGIPTPRYEKVDSVDDLADAVRKFGPAVVLKTRRFGYDGKGQVRVEAPESAEDAFSAVAHGPSIAEELIDFDRELSLIAVRSLSGETAFYPLIENEHRDGILHRSQAPAPNVSPRTQELALQYGALLLEYLDYVGVLTIEFFDKGGVLIANEIAPRVHNSGHWSIEGAETSQFTNHLLAITGQPLGSTRCPVRSEMINLIGFDDPNAYRESKTNVYLHWYGKEPRPGRKVGHVTTLLECYQ